MNRLEQIKIPKEWVDGFDKYYKQYQAMHLWTRAEALAFTTLLAIVPTFGFLFWFLNRVGVTQEWLEKMKNFLFVQLNVASNEQLIRIFDSILISLKSQTWGLIGLFFLAYSCWGLITKFGASQDVILNVRFAEKTPITLSFLRLTLRRAFIMLILPLVLLSSIFVASWIREESLLKYLFSIDTVGPFLALPISWLVSVAALTVLYFFIPQKKVRWRDAFKAAVVVTLSLELTRFLVGHFNSYAVMRNKIYGVFAAIPITILWIQIAWTILVAGGLLLKPQPIKRQKKRKKA